MLENYKNKIILGDCLEVMKGLPDKCIDLVLTDPPYLFKQGGRGCGLAGDRKYLIDIPDKKLGDNFDISIYLEFQRVCKTFNLIIFASKEQLRQNIEFADKNKYNWQVITWHKTNPTPLINGNYLPDTEYLFHIYKKGTLYGGYADKSKYYISQVEKNEFNHPTVKPIQLIKKLLINGSQEGDIVLDSFSGMATTALACYDLNRNFICIEKDPEYHAASVERLEKHKRQLKLL